MVELAPKLGVLIIMLPGLDKQVFIWRKLLDKLCSEVAVSSEEREVLGTLIGMWFDQFNGDMIIALEMGWITPFGRVTLTGYQECAERWAYRSEALKQTDELFALIIGATEAVWEIGGE